MKQIAYFHLPGLFEFYEFYKAIPVIVLGAPGVFL